MAKGLTERQTLVLESIVGHVKRYGYPPSIREIGKALEIKSLRGVTVHLDALERKKFIHRDSTSRSIQVLKTPWGAEEDGFVRLPILGTIAAGVPILAEQNIEGEIPIPLAMIGSARDAFVLKVKGDSMIDAHIVEGDLLVVRQQQTAENGDLVAALLGDEATVKRLRKEGNTAMLMPANPAYQPIPLRNKDVRLMGKVIGLVRSY